MSVASASVAGASARCRGPASIIRKQIVAITGLGLAGFVLVHMAGNMLLFVSPQAYNEYSHKLVSNPAIYIAELGLVLFFIGHIFQASYLTYKNYRARPIGYAMRATKEKRTPWVHRTLFAQGMIILAFSILHLATFKYGPDYKVDYGHGQIRDLYKLVIEVFQDPGYVAWYVFALLILGMHLSHGVRSTIQTFGIHHPRYQGKIRAFGYLYALIVMAGFLSQPIYVFLASKGYL